MFGRESVVLSGGRVAGCRGLVVALVAANVTLLDGASNGDRMGLHRPMFLCTICVPIIDNNMGNPARE